MPHDSGSKPMPVDTTEKSFDRWIPAATRFGWCLLFALAHTQSPLYYSNQHQYFLHGLAWAGVGHLREDWLANTADPTPLFSGWVALTYRVLGEWMFQVIYTLILAGYAAIGWWVYDQVCDSSRQGGGRWLFLVLLTFVHWAPLRLASAYSLGCDYPWYLQAGVAGQYILGPGLQPSVAGVLLLAATVIAATRSWIIAMIVAGLACLIHSTYLLSAAFLTLACMILAWPDGWRRSITIGTVSLLVVAPVLVFNALVFAPTDSATFAESQRIIAEDRIPHHAQIRRWFDLIAALQYVWIFIGIVAARHPTLRRIMAITLCFSIVGTLAQWVTGLPTLALLFPWRMTAILVPLATMIVLSRLANRIAPSGIIPGLRTGSLGALIVLATGGLIVMTAGIGYRSSPEELPLLEFVRAHARSGQVYLIPVEIPRHDKAKRGSISTTFTRPPRRDRDHGLISVDLQRFRLHTGVPIYVDFKSIPYKDVEVIEWWRRVTWAHQLYQTADWSDPRLREDLVRRGITHVVMPTKKAKSGIGPLLFWDEHYTLYAVAPP